jgi:hypothetical protein
MKNLYSLALAAALAAVPAAADARNSVSGTSAGLQWKAQSLIVGQTSTATVLGGGNPIYFANQPRYSGAVTLIMQYDDGGASICTGSMIGSNSVLTAAHCVSDGAGTRGPARVRAYFTDSLDPDFVRYDPTADFDAAAGAVAIDVSRVYVNPDYTGEVIDQNDIAVLRLETAAPSYAQIYGLFTEGDLTGARFNVVGNGARSDTGGDVGDNLGVGRMRQGDNIYDYRFGDPVFGGFFDGFFGTADASFSYVSDFDNGLAGNDTACLIAGLFAAGFGCAPTVGDLEVGVAGGDSGGPQFIDGRIASVTSYGLTFGPDFGDVDDDLNSSFGEFSGYVPVFIHESWIGGVVPEPATWAMMIAGFGFVGAAMRRRRDGLTA